MPLRLSLPINLRVRGNGKENSYERALEKTPFVSNQLFSELFEAPKTQAACRKDFSTS